MASADPFSKHSRSLTSPPENAAEIIPDDSALLPNVTRAVHIGAPGDLRVEMLGGEVVTLAGLQSGTMIPLRVCRVFATGTTTAAIVGLW